MTEHIFVGTDTEDKRQNLLLSMANRHGLIAGATGTGKTVTLQILAEGFSKAGVPVFAADVKGDLSGISQAGSEDHKLHDTRLMGLNETQEGILTIAFELADDEAMLLLDLKDLRALLNFLSDNKAEMSREYGNITSQSVAAIQRRLLLLERAGAEAFFAEPALQLEDLMRVNDQGQGIVSVLAANKLINSPALYSTFLLWLLSELFEELPEVGNPDKPKMVFFFDEAHLLFDDAPKALIDKIEQVARLIRSKGVGIYFVTQNPMDIPDSVLGQLGNRIQHALRAYTPKEQKALRAAASSFRENPDFDTAEVITDLGVGEALVSLLNMKGAPEIVRRTLIRPPVSRLGPAKAAERKALIAVSDLKDKYTETIDRESAYEMLEAKALAHEEAAEKAAEKAEADAKKEKAAAAKKKKSPTKRRSTRRKKSVGQTLGYEAKLIARQIVRSQGRRILRGLLGGLIRR